MQLDTVIKDNKYSNQYSNLKIIIIIINNVLLLTVTDAARIYKKLKFRIIATY
jgi:uncharacterized membrane protein